MGQMIGDVYRNITEILLNAHIDGYDFDANCIIEDVCKISKIKRMLYPETVISDEDFKRCRYLAQKRAEHEPLQYLLGEWEFYGERFIVGSGVLIPRQDTETLVDAAEEYIDYFDKSKKIKYVDLFSGTGCIPIIIEKHLNLKNISNEIYAVESEDMAVKYLNKNIGLHKSEIKIIHGDALNEKIINNFKNIDLITANPPYLTEDDMKHLQTEVKFEPKSALYGGKDGLYFYENIIPLYKKCLNRGGILAVEIGFEQEKAVCNIFEKTGYKDIEFKKDYTNKIRVVLGKV